MWGGEKRREREPIEHEGMIGETCGQWESYLDVPNRALFPIHVRRLERENEEESSERKKGVRESPCDT